MCVCRETVAGNLARTKHPFILQDLDHEGIRVAELPLILDAGWASFWCNLLGQTFSSLFLALRRWPHPSIGFVPLALFSALPSS